MSAETIDLTITYLLGDHGKLKLLVGLMSHYGTVFTMYRFVGITEAGLELA